MLVDVFRVLVPVSVRPPSSLCFPLLLAFRLASSFETSSDERQSLNFRRHALLPLSKYSALVTENSANWSWLANAKAERYASVIGLHINIKTNRCTKWGSQAHTHHIDRSLPRIRPARVVWALASCMHAVFIKVHTAIPNSWTYSLSWKPGNLVVPPIKPMFAQNMPCKSSGKSATDAAIVAANPDWCKPAPWNERPSMVAWKQRPTDIIRPKQNFGNRKTLVVHDQNLILFSDDIVWMSYPPLSICGEIREYIFLDNGIALGVLSSWASVQVQWVGYVSLRSAYLQRSRSFPNCVDT